MEQDEQPVGRTWRIRARLADHPGQLATLAARLAQRECNLLSVTVLPVADGLSGADRAVAVIDEFVLRAPTDLRRGELVTLLESSGARCVGVGRASVSELSDGPTTLLRAASRWLESDRSPYEPLRQVLGADHVRPVAQPVEPSTPGEVQLRSHGHEALIPLPNGGWAVALREWTPFTEGELARVSAVLALLQQPLRSDAPAAVGLPPQLRRQLSSLDVQFLNAETARTPTHIGLVTIVDPTTAPGGQVTLDAVRSLIGSRLHLVDALRWKLHAVPLGLDRPYWLDAGELDLARHVREERLPAPGTDAQLGEVVARLAQAPLPRAQPLWEAYLIHGLSGGRQALYTKVHHAVVDGVSGAEVLAVIFDLTAQPRAVQPPPRPLAPERPPGSAEMLHRALVRTVRLPAQLARSMPVAGPHLIALARSAGSPRTPFNSSLTANRSFAFTSLSLEQVKQVKDALAITVNDVVMALCTATLRRWLIAHDALPERPILASIPVSVRTPELVGTAGNQISFMLAALPTEQPDPAVRLRRLSTSIADAKQRHLSAPRLLHDGSELIPQLLHGLASRLLLRVATHGAPPFNLFVSNVPGPQLQLFAAGARVLANYPVSVVNELGGGLSITVMSYAGRLDFGVIACRDVVPDVWSLTEPLQNALDELLELAGVGLAPERAEG